MAQIETENREREKRFEKGLPGFIKVLHDRNAPEESSRSSSSIAIGYTGTRSSIFLTMQSSLNDANGGYFFLNPFISHALGVYLGPGAEEGSVFLIIR